jgi:hypothetical protein
MRKPEPPGDAAAGSPRPTKRRDRADPASSPHLEEVQSSRRPKPFPTSGQRHHQFSGALPEERHTTPCPRNAPTFAALEWIWGRKRARPPPTQPRARRRPAPLRRRPHPPAPRIESPTDRADLGEEGEAKHRRQPPWIDRRPAVSPRRPLRCGSTAQRSFFRCPFTTHPVCQEETMRMKAKPSRPPQRRGSSGISKTADATTPRTVAATTAPAVVNLFDMAVSVS